jgi:cold shock protein
MASGKVKWFDTGTGYGFIHPDEDGVDVFFHTSAIRGQGEHKLQKGDEVLFQSEDSPRGPEAITITVIKAIPET